jgi:MFS family permease
MVNGLIVQVLNLGIFIGPPAFAALVALLGGWQGGRWLFAGFGLICLGLGLLVRRIEQVKPRP